MKIEKRVLKTDELKKEIGKNFLKIKSKLKHTHTNSNLYPSNQRSNPQISPSIFFIFCELVLQFLGLLQKNKAAIFGSFLKIELYFLFCLIDSLKKKIIQNEFIDVYEKDLLKNVLDKPTLLERSILDLEESHDCENEDREIQLLNQHLSGKMVAMKDDKTEKILLKFTQELSKLLEQKKPKWCPVIYLENSITGGLDAIKIKNAYD